VNFARNKCAWVANSCNVQNLRDCCHGSLNVCFSLSYCLHRGHMAVSLAFAINLLILAIPTVKLAFAWNRLVADWRNEVVQSTAGTACLAFASTSTLVALGSLFCEVFVRPFPWRDYRTEVSGFLVSVVSLVSAFSTREKHQHGYWQVGSAAAVYMFCGLLRRPFPINGL